MRASHRGSGGMSIGLGIFEVVSRAYVFLMFVFCQLLRCVYVVLSNTCRFEIMLLI